MENSQLAYGIDIGGTNTKMGIFDSTGALLADSSIKTEGFGNPEDFVIKVVKECEKLITDLGYKLGDPRFVGAGIGAPVANFFTGMIEHAANLGWKNVPLKALFEKHLRTNVVIENDANLAAMGEKRWGAGAKYSDFILITLGTGVGQGLVFNGLLHRGHQALGGEGGHVIIPAVREDRTCACGGLNHLEAFLSAAGIERTITEVTGEQWSIENFGNYYREGNPKAIAAMEAVTDDLVTGLIGMAVTVGPQAFIIAGGVSKLGASLNDMVKAKIDERIFLPLRGKIDVLTATLSTEKGAIYGGAALIFHERHA